MTATKPHVPYIWFIGPAATHDYACPVCLKRHAVYNCNEGYMSPCWECQSEGWETRQRKPSWLRRLLRWGR